MKYILSILVFMVLVFYITANPTTPKKPNVKKINKKVRTTSPNANTVIDTYKGVNIYDNGGISNTYGRNLTKDGYNLGLKWQCVEFIKRFYFKSLNHKMPNSYGHAKDFFDKGVNSGWNKDRALYQFANGQRIKPRANSILVFDGNHDNPYGHVAIISAVHNDYIEVCQQNWGKQTRMTLPLVKANGQYYVDHDDILGWLSKG